MSVYDKVYYRIKCGNCKHSKPIMCGKKKFIECKVGLGIFPTSSAFIKCKGYEPKQTPKTNKYMARW